MTSVLAFILTEYDVSNGVEMYYLYTVVMLVYVIFMFGSIANLIGMNIWQRTQFSMLQRGRTLQEGDVELQQIDPVGATIEPGANGNGPRTEQGSQTEQLAPDLTQSAPHTHSYSRFYLPNMLWVTLMISLVIRTIWNANKVLLVDIIIQANYTIKGNEPFTNSTGIPFTAVSLICEFLGFATESSLLAVMLLVAQGFCIVRHEFENVNQFRMFISLTSVSLLLQVVTASYTQLYAVVLFFLSFIIIRSLLLTIQTLKNFQASLNRFIRFSNSASFISTLPLQYKIEMLQRILSAYYLYSVALLLVIVTTRLISIANVGIISEAIDIVFHIVLIALLRLRKPLKFDAGLSNSDIVSEGVEPTQDVEKVKPRIPNYFVVMAPQNLPIGHQSDGSQKLFLASEDVSMLNSCSTANALQL